MLCGLSLFESNIIASHADWLIRNFSFSGSFVIRDGIEIPSPSRKNANRTEGEKEYDPFIWRKLFFREMGIRLGWKTNPLTGNPDYRLKLIGSIHKFARGGDNSGFFSAIAAIAAINELCLIFKVHPEKLKITNLEIGVNIPVGFDIPKFLKLNLIRYKNTPFTVNGKKPNGYEACLTHYWVKLYAKNGVLRFEIHWADMCELRSQYELFYVSDLTPELINTIAYEKLMERLGNIALLDGIDLVTSAKKRKDGMTGKELDILIRYSNNIYLSQLENEKETSDKKRRHAITQKDSRYRKMFNELNKKYGTGIVKELNNTIKAIIQRSKDEIQHSEKCDIPEIGIKLKNVTFLDQEGDMGQTKVELINNYKINTMDTMELKNNIGITNTDVLTNKRSKKQMDKEKREKLAKQYGSFMNALKVTLDKIAA